MMPFERAFPQSAKEFKLVSSIFLMFNSFRIKCSYFSNLLLMTLLHNTIETHFLCIYKITITLFEISYLTQICFECCVQFLKILFDKNSNNIGIRFYFLPGNIKYSKLIIEYFNWPTRTIIQKYRYLWLKRSF